MSDLGLAIAASAITADQTELDTAGQNLANVQTPGYARESVGLGNVEPALLDGAGQGVLITGVTAETSSLYEQLNYLSSAGLGAANQSALIASTAQNIIPEPSTTALGAQLNQFFSDLSSLATQPSNAAAADTVVQDAANVANTLSSTSASFTQTSVQLQNDLEGMGSTTGGLIGQANQLITQIAQLNSQIAQGSTGNIDVNGLRDAQRNDLNQLATLTGIRTQVDSVGMTDVWIGGIQVVSGATGNTLQTSGSALTGNLGISTQTGVAVPAGGQIGALLEGVNTTIPGYQSQLDAVADSLATQVNALQAAGTAANGTPGSANPALFVNGGSTTTYTPGSASASTIAINPALLANPSLLSTAAAGTVGASNDPTTTQEMAAIGSQPGGPNALYGELVATVGDQGSAANSAQTNAQDLANSASSELASVEGVNTNEETVNLLQAQQAFQATAAVVNSINTSFTSLLQAV